VDETKDGIPFLKNHSGEKAAVPYQKADYFDLFDSKPILLSKGDQVVITKNAQDQFKHRMNNGDFLKVDQITRDNKLVLINPKSQQKYTVSKDFGHIKHGYVVTSHASQGKTVDEVFISQPASTFPATDAKQFYVSASRGRKAAHIYTDDKEELLEHASTIGDRKSALELAKENGISEDHAIERSAEKIKEKSQTLERNSEKEKYLDHLSYEPER
jgi:ATP-dependent exoDNAse (exonuclease V) alpha subunit